ncbi:hypothetical protein AX16_001364 [Volvariella volvacea WC 439]|nr:hypothetical protein AX16_001364 [Volvariella volvacea WC 439]
MQSSLYEILGVTNAASPEEIRRAYRRRILETHPDKVSATASARAKELALNEFQKVQQAYEVLSDPSQRRTYDHDRKRYLTSTHLQRAQLTRQPPSTSMIRTKPPEQRKAGLPKIERKVEAFKIGQRAETWKTVRQETLGIDTSKAYEAQVVQREMRIVKEEKPKEIARKERYDELVENMLQSFVQATPEWEERRRKVIERRLEQERRRATQQHIVPI